MINNITIKKITFLQHTDIIFYIKKYKFFIWSLNKTREMSLRGWPVILWPNSAICYQSYQETTGGGGEIWAAKRVKRFKQELNFRPSYIGLTHKTRPVYAPNVKTQELPTWPKTDL